MTTTTQIRDAASCCIGDAERILASVASDVDEHEEFAGVAYELLGVADQLSGLAQQLEDIADGY
jgi:hypothetical protein